MKRNKRIILNLAAILSLALVVTTAWLWVRSYRAQSPASRPGVPPAVNTQIMLAHRISQLRFDHISLTDALEFLRDVTGLSIRMDREALDAAGVEGTTPVSLDLKNTRVGEGLAQILSAGNGLEFVADGTVILISSKAAFAQARKGGHANSAVAGKWTELGEGGAVSEFELRQLRQQGLPRRWIPRHGGKPSSGTFACHSTFTTELCASG